MLEAVGCGSTTPQPGVPKCYKPLVDLPVEGDLVSDLLGTQTTGSRQQLDVTGNQSVSAPTGREESIIENLGPYGFLHDKRQAGDVPVEVLTRLK